MIKLGKVEKNGENKMRKYEFTRETKEAGFRTLHRIRAVINFGDVKVGDLGGFIEREENLSHDGTAWVYASAWICDNARIFGNARIFDNVKVFDNAKVCSNAIICDNAEICGNRMFCSNEKAD